MSVAIERMDADDLRPIDEAIIEVLREGRNNAPNLAAEFETRSEMREYDKQYIRERLGRLKEAGVVVSIGSGIYELVPEEVPGDAE